MASRIYQGWWQLVVAMLVQAINAGCIFTAYSVVTAPLKLEFAPSNMVLMLGMTATSLVSGLLSPVLGTAIDRFSVRNMMMLGATLVATAFMLISLTGNMVQVVLIYAAGMSVASVLLGPIATSALLARWFTTKRGLAMGLAASGSAIGGLLLPPLLQQLIDGLEWRMAMQAFSGVILLITLPAIRWLVVDWPPQANTTGELGAKTPTLSPMGNATDSLSAMLADRNFWLLCLVVGSLFCGPISIIGNLMQLVGEKGIQPSEGAFLISIFSAANFGGKLFVAATADRVDHRLALAITLLGVAAGAIGLFSASQFSWLGIACGVVGLFSGGASPLWSVTLAHIYGAQRIGKIMGTMTLAIMPFTLLGPPVFGRVFDMTGSYGNALLGYIGLLTLALIAATQLKIRPVENN